MTERVDVHQHLWPEPLLAALSRRSRPPLVRMGVYGVASDGTLRREAVGATHELRAECPPA
jgi:hypothetical protein